jgi:DNA-binding LacI/PurR family transcriptional regulator
MGAMATRLLLATIAGPVVDAQEMVLPADLVVRASCGAAYQVETSSQL